MTWTITNVAPFTNGSVTLTVRVNETAKEVGTDEMVATVDNAASVSYTHLDVYKRQDQA